jgi:DnaK suppressor protein
LRGGAQSLRSLRVLRGQNGSAAVQGVALPLLKREDASIRVESQEENMMEKIVQDAQQMLRERRQMLLGTLRDQASDDVGNNDEPRDRAAIAAEGEVRHHLADREQAELREIDAALRRIEEGSFGHCEKCNHAIGKQRLRAVPEARLCLDCGSGRPSTRAGA